MKKQHGYYTGCLELNGFKTPFVVYATSNKQAATKALKGIRQKEDAIIVDLEGPYLTVTI